MSNRFSGGATPKPSEGHAWLRRAQVDVGFDSGVAVVEQGAEVELAGAGLGLEFQGQILALIVVFAALRRL
jgi:hypothetical protein